MLPAHRVLRSAIFFLGDRSPLSPLKPWKDTSRIGDRCGFRLRASGRGDIGRTAVILKPTGLTLISSRRHDSHEAGLSAGPSGTSWMFEGHDAILAVDLCGGHQHRACGCSSSIIAKRPLTSQADVWKFALGARTRMRLKRRGRRRRPVDMLKRLTARSDKQDLLLAPLSKSAVRARSNRMLNRPRAQNCP